MKSKLSHYQLEQYIDKHGLTQRVVSPEGHGTPPGLTVRPGDDFAVYGTDDGSHVVVVNISKKMFKISHRDMITLESDWLDARNDYDTDARPFWQSTD